MSSLSYATVNKWAAEFKRDRGNTEDDPWSGRFKTSTTDEQVDAHHRILLDDKRLYCPAALVQLWFTMF